MARHDPELVKAFEANRTATIIALSATALANIAAMSPASRKFRADEVEMQAIRNDILANRPGHPDADYYRRVANDYRAELAALRSFGA